MFIFVEHNANKTHAMTTQTTAAEIIARKSLATFNTLASATSYRDHCHSPGKYSIVLGDNDLIWLVTNREAFILANAGYTLA